MVALLFFIFQDAAKAGKDTCNTELDIETPLKKKLLQIQTSPKQVSAAESQIVQCKCKKYTKNKKNV
eukprot:CAMPEP_0172838744 /NCGR_PEP_ID=MMETSP1075-20121228/28088_1 /TAXON_ID=2916 /ORGANISM="Ceratium fusus, Strain PA161109" /LENGTH=66 /DNA_ID=CAMNT_0013682299 /DNA_START=10 /DNA_END=210 /DNA_ORIENTATION=+